MSAEEALEATNRVKDYMLNQSPQAGITYIVRHIMTAIKCCKTWVWIPIEINRDYCAPALPVCNPDGSERKEEDRVYIVPEAIEELKTLGYSVEVNTSGWTDGILIEWDKKDVTK